MDDTENTDDFVERRYSSTLLGVVNTVEWVIIALILAFVFRAFIMEAFRIPTGSMAETLRGAHYHLRCEQCGYKSDLGADDVGSGGPKCPSCNFTESEPISKMSSNGDRILVLKCIYEFTDPKRWDVVVFKYPVDPEQNFIKRMIGLPGEKIEILDGDFYINGKIARKPPKVQGEMWMPIYDNDYQPLAATAKPDSEPKFNWIQPFKNVSNKSVPLFTGDVKAKWKMNESGTTHFTLDSPLSNPDYIGDEGATIAYDPKQIDDFRAYYAYNQTIQYSLEPLCTDLKVRFYVHDQNPEGWAVGKFKARDQAMSNDWGSYIRAGLRKYNILYQALVQLDGQMIIQKVIGNDTSTVAWKNIEMPATSKGTLFEFSCVDRQLILKFGKETLKYELGQAIEDMTRSETKGSLVEISGAGKMKLSHVAVFRDSYYTNGIRPRPNQPFTVGADEFFVCGDNSPKSYDSRLWSTPGKGNRSSEYTKGIVPRDYLMGKAFFLYWGDAFKPLGTNVPIIPNFSQMKVIYGGSNDQL